MKKITFIFILCFSFLQGNSQTIDSVQVNTNCNGSGMISISLNTAAASIVWYFLDSNMVSQPLLDSLNNQTVGDTLVYFTVCGTYICNIYDISGGISDQDTFYIDCPMVSELRGQNNLLCFGDSTGMLKEIVTGGIPFDPDGIVNSGDEYYIYSWYKNGTLLSSAQNDTLLTFLTIGSYNVNVEDQSGCIFQHLDTIGNPNPSNISQPFKLYVDSLVINSVHCKGTNTGSVLVSINGGRFIDSVYRYDYYLTNSNNDTIRTINGSSISQNVVLDTLTSLVLFDSLSVGSYTLSITDSNNCIMDSTIYVMEPDNYTLHVSINPLIVCEQDSTWLKIDSISGGNPVLGYNWLGTSADSIFVRSGTYTVFITDLIYGCKDSIDYTLTAPNTIYCNVTSKIAECFGTNSGSLQVDSIYGGISPYSVQWGGIDTNNLFAGLYTLFITDSLGCIYIDEHEVFENPDVILNETIYTPLCFGDANGSISINISGGTSSLSYSWLNAAGTPDSVYNLTEGTYYVNTIDSLGCTFSDSVIVVSPNLLEVAFSGYTNPLTCNGGQTLINTNIGGGTAPYSLLWNTGNVEDTLYQIVVSAAVLEIDIIDENGCSANQQIVITEPDILVASGSFIPATCNLGASASVIYTGGTSPVTYIWSNGETSSSASDFGGGDQWVIITDSCGDTSMYTFSVVAYELETDIYHVNNPNNFAEVEVINSTIGSPFNYQWYDMDMNPIAGEVNAILEDLCPEWYFVTTIDGNNCEVTDSILAELYFPMGGIIDENATSVYNDSLLWGAAPYTYLWDNGDITAHGNICPGYHRVWVTDVNGCEVVGSVTVEEIVLNLTPSEILIECDITNLNVELEVSATGGTGDYSYLWSSGETMNPINLSLNPGVYSVEIMDANFCKVDTVFHIAAMTSDCIPNVFTPNNDGSNDVWNLEDAFFFSDSEVRVYGRYGKLLFKSVGYLTPWDGTNQSGNQVEDGAYFYVIDLGDDIEKIKGTVTIIR